MFEALKTAELDSTGYKLTFVYDSSVWTEQEVKKETCIIPIVLWAAGMFLFLVDGTLDKVI